MSDELFGIQDELRATSSPEGVGDIDPLSFTSPEDDIKPSIDGKGDTSSTRHLLAREIIPRWNLSRIVRELGTREQCVEFAIENGLILRSKDCLIHKQPMQINYAANKSVGTFVCNKGNCRMKSCVSRIQGTWFAKTKLTLPHVYYLMYCYAHQWSDDSVILENPWRETECLSSATIVEFYNYCREAVLLYKLKQQSVGGKIGGPGKIVQVDESKFDKRKYYKGKPIEGHWVLGLLEDGSEALRLEVCPGKILSADVLLPLIKKHVKEGTIIHTGNWQAYDRLCDHGYIHKKVNHSDPDDPFVVSDGTRTQRFASQWRLVKRFFYEDNYNHPSRFTDMLVESLWRRDNVKEKRDPFIALIGAIKEIYKP